MIASCRSVGKAISFGYFSLGQQRKVTWARQRSKRLCRRRLTFLPYRGKRVQRKAKAFRTLTRTSDFSLLAQRKVAKRNAFPDTSTAGDRAGTPRFAHSPSMARVRTARVLRAALRVSRLSRVSALACEHIYRGKCFHTDGDGNISGPVASPQSTAAHCNREDPGGAARPMRAVSTRGRMPSVEIAAYSPDREL